MRRLFLYGGQTDHFIATAAPFVQAAGGGSALVGLLFATGEPGWDVCLDWYRSRMTQLGAEVMPIHPEGNSLTFSAKSLEALRRCSGIFMCGGNTLRYHQVYTAGEVRRLIGSAYRAGIPYGGLSAGALIAPEIGSIWGDRLTTPANRLTLLGSEDGCDDELLTGPALGLLPGYIIECHFSEQGGFPRLVAEGGLHCLPDVTVAEADAAEYDGLMYPGRPGHDPCRGGGVAVQLRARAA